VEARALSRDDRLDYEISLKSKELQPGAPRFVDLPAKVAFSLARDAAVDLTSFGDKETLGVLKDRDGSVVEQLTAAPTIGTSRSRAAWRRAPIRSN